MKKVISLFLVICMLSISSISVFADSWDSMSAFYGNADFSVSTAPSDYYESPLRTVSVYLYFDIDDGLTGYYAEMDSHAWYTVGNDTWDLGEYVFTANSPNEIAEYYQVVLPSSVPAGGTFYTSTYCSLDGNWGFDSGTLNTDL